MGEEEQAKEFLKAKREAEDLAKSLRCLTVRKGRLMDKIGYMHDCMGRYLSDDALESGASTTPDFRDWPSEDDLRELFRDMQDTSNRLLRAKNRLHQF